MAQPFCTYDRYHISHTCGSRMLFPARRGDDVLRSSDVGPLNTCPPF